MMGGTMADAPEVVAWGMVNKNETIRIIAQSIYLLTICVVAFQGTILSSYTCDSVWRPALLLVFSEICNNDSAKNLNPLLVFPVLWDACLIKKIIKYDVCKTLIDTENWKIIIFIFVT